jgi:hypothetical protein
MPCSFCHSREISISVAAVAEVGGADRRNMSMEGLIPFVCGAISKRRAAKRAVDYERLSSAGAPPTRGWGHERLPGGAYDHPRSQSCRFAARSSPDERGFSRDEGVRDEPSPPGGDGWRGLSKSRRFSSMRFFGCVSGA